MFEGITRCAARDQPAFGPSPTGCPCLFVFLFYGLFCSATGLITIFSHLILSMLLCGKTPPGIGGHSM
jgi:hypothetical protein